MPKYQMTIEVDTDNELCDEHGVDVLLSSVRKHIIEVIRRDKYEQYKKSDQLKKDMMKTI